MAASWKRLTYQQAGGEARLTRQTRVSPRSLGTGQTSSPLTDGGQPPREARATASSAASGNGGRGFCSTCVMANLARSDFWSSGPGRPDEDHDRGSVPARPSRGRIPRLSVLAERRMVGARIADIPGPLGTAHG